MTEQEEKRSFTDRVFGPWVDNDWTPAVTVMVIAFGGLAAFVEGPRLVDMLRESAIDKLLVNMPNTLFNQH